MPKVSAEHLPIQDVFDVAWPCWVPYGSRCWRVGIAATGDYYRKPPADGKHEVYTFRTGEEALDFIIKHFDKLKEDR